MPLADLRYSAPVLVKRTSVPTSPYEAAMQRLRFAVLDVETTSGNPIEGRVMEVAVLAHDGAHERLRWDSLVDPRALVSPFVTKLTGIGSNMLVDAPPFVDIVRTLETLTQDRIIVAHNVRFDMTALTHEFARTGLTFERPTLCTERLTRRLIPNLDRYNLGNVCRHLGVPFTVSHRALVDAEATAGLLLNLMDRFGTEAILDGVVPWKHALRA
ncbi:MAG: 3'-5' exonuclease [Flavobacteriales bacterium]|nr:3'-5' exonuclease [Flavobacteriales bacterium]MBK6945180.1 3'-5' exonuclease [Flavobacteriales bacterium]MBK7296074.1 3'-5' exonuclease [Flavobacteriales bacterium]MBK9535265.1 3'-5' exonuclease [Flavobacteriales bacterium]MBP9138836.1 3'-5' exonuclease [Flavobacteriales bacterium]